MSILDVITTIRESFPNAEKVYTQGSCIQFCLILSTIFPQGEIYYNEDHAIFKLNDLFYDITGEVEPKGHINIKEYPPHKINKLFKLKYEGNNN